MSLQKTTICTSFFSILLGEPTIDVGGPSSSPPIFHRLLAILLIFYISRPASPFGSCGLLRCRPCRRLREIIGKTQKTPRRFVFEFFCDFYGTYVSIIGLKAPGNCSGSFWSNEISVLLCEGPKPPNSMISNFLSPGEPLFIDLDIPNYLNEHKKIMETFSEINISINLKMLEISQRNSGFHNTYNI